MQKTAVASKKSVVQPKASAKAKAVAPTFARLGARLRQVRRSQGLTQEQMGELKFVSTPGWIKLENGQRQPSEKLITNLCGILVTRKAMSGKAALALRDELLLLKYLTDPSEFVRGLAIDRLNSQAQAAATGKGGASK